MTAEYNRLIRRFRRVTLDSVSFFFRLVARYMIKHVDGYLPPVDWKPSKLMKKIIIPIEPVSDLLR